ncbi:hypothetical protein [Sediminitomix flava]|uniref:Uncharacterized protein n=1 Tax=Sediminitomix flava TaxID=379075 RepID=A0A315Z1F5_SEDFL|nr:hypothetical protein [Sediminitomix flava]PWJ36135.1 hypothetical protein BC781_109151 [Sediminitomix flava]
MLTDHWVITQLIGGSCSVILLVFASFQSIGFIRNWNASKYDEQQLQMERKTYLLASILQATLVFQILLLLIFLFTVNIHLPQIIKGAMCAAGTLALNSYGYPLLFLKMGGVFVYFSFLVLNAIDDKAPDYPLTPKKYWLVFPSMLIALTDLVFTVLYYVEISPDIITTCCSLSFSSAKQDAFFQNAVSNFSSTQLIGLHIGSYLLLAICFFWRKSKLTLLMSLAFTLSSYFAIKYHYIKFIYGLPSHLCLFDAFNGQYYYVGIWISIGLYGLICLNFYDVLRKTLNLTESSNRRFQVSLFTFFSILAVGIPISYLLFSGYTFS